MWYLMLSHTDLPPVSAEVSKEALANHFAFLKRQHAAGNILFSGPTPDAPWVSTSSRRIRTMKPSQ